MKIPVNSPVQFFLNQATNNLKATIDSFTDTIILFDSQGRNPSKGILFEWDDDDDEDDELLVIATPFFYNDALRDLYFHSEATEAYFNVTRAEVLEFSKIRILSDILDYFPIGFLERYDPNDELPYAECLNEYEVDGFVQRVLTNF